MAPNLGSPKPEMACMTPLWISASEGGRGLKRGKLDGKARKRDDGWEIRSSGRWKEKNWCILKSFALIICVGICCRGELSDEEESRSLDVTLPLLESSEVLKPTPLLCDAECCTGGCAGGSVVDGEALLPGCEGH